MNPFRARLIRMKDHPVYVIAAAISLVVTLGKAVHDFWPTDVVDQCRSLAGAPATIPGTEDELAAVAQDKSADAVHNCGQAAAEKSQDLALRFDLARAYEANGQTGVAISEYQTAAKAGYVPAMDVFGRRLNSLGDESGAIKWLQCAAAKGSRQAEYDLSLIFLARSRGDDLPKARWLASRSSQAGFQPASKLIATVESFPGSERKVAEDWLAAQACSPLELTAQAASSVK